MQTAFLTIAEECLTRGWYVFPCRPKTKEPAIKNGFHGASNDPEKIREWWTRWPDANVGIATGKSGLCVVDIDHGLAGESDFFNWREPVYLPMTYTVQTGRRDGFGVQLYYHGEGLKSIAWKAGDVSGDIRCSTGYVMAAGSIHPSGNPYTCFLDYPVADASDWVRGLKPERGAGVADDGEPITAGRNNALTSIAGKLRNAGLTAAALEAALLQVNADRCVPPLEDGEVQRIARNASEWAFPEVQPEVVIGGKSASTTPRGPVEPVDWRTRYMTDAAYLNVKPPEFLIEGFLVRKSIAMLAGPVAQRKSIIALNIAHALCTGEPLFGYFDVPGGHERVLYLCPEMGAASFVKRIKSIGLGAYMNKTLFVQTMSEQPTALDDLDGELPGAVVIVDTITRFIEGDENKSEDMRRFAQKVFRLMNAGATVVLLHHSKKGSSGSLDDGLRGSSELAAFVDSCWVTELEDPKKPYESVSKVRNVKQRDFESDPFKLKPAPGSYYLAMDGEPAPEAVLKSRAEDAAVDVLRKLLATSPKMGINKLLAAMRKAGHGKGQAWLIANRAALSSSGVTLAEQPYSHTSYP